MNCDSPHSVGLLDIDAGGPHELLGAGFAVAIHDVVAAVGQDVAVPPHGNTADGKSWCRSSEWERTARSFLPSA
jgi:hypothetical protein